MTQTDAKPLNTTHFDATNHLRDETDVTLYLAAVASWNNPAEMGRTVAAIERAPARYCTGYLSDVATQQPYPPGDFAAWFEVYLDGRWHTFDPRNNTPRIGRVLIARGRDAADVAMVTTFGPNTLESFRVWTDEVPEIAGK